MSHVIRLGFLAGIACLGAVASPEAVSKAEALPVAAVQDASSELGQSTPVVHRRSHKPRRHARARVYVTPGYGPGFAGFGAPVFSYPGYPGPGSGYAFDPARIGPGGAYQGNVPGCAIDLGYGRYESCSLGR